MQPIHERMTGWPAAVQLQVSSYVQDHGLDPDRFLAVDLALVLLRIGGDEALRCVQELTGRVITKCPTAMPPWPPKPVAGAPRGPVVTKVAPNPCAASPMQARYDILKVGMSRSQLLARGVTARDIRYWVQHDYIAFTEGS